MAVDGPEAVEILCAGLKDGPDHADAGVVDHDVEAVAVFRQDRGDQALAGVFLGHVEGSEAGFLALVLDGLDRGLAADGVAIRDDHESSRFRESHGDGGSDA